MNVVLKEGLVSEESQIQIVQGDLTQENVDAIVNAANAHLMHGGGVAGVISRKGGPSIQQESDAWVSQHGPVQHGEPAYTTAGNLPCRYVIHAVGPVWGEGEEDAKLEAAVTGSFQRAEELGLKSIAFPAISTGIFGYPVERAAGVILHAIRNYFTQNPGTGIKQVRVVLFDRSTAETFLKAWEVEP